MTGEGDRLLFEIFVFFSWEISSFRCLRVLDLELRSEDFSSSLFFVLERRKARSGEDLFLVLRRSGIVEAGRSGEDLFRVRRRSGIKL